MMGNDLRPPDHENSSSVEIVARPARCELDLLTEGQRSVFQVWSSLRDSSAVVRVVSIDPIHLRGQLGNLHLLDIVDSGLDFRYRIYGTQIALVARNDWHKRYVSEMPAPMGPALLTHYRGLVADRQARVAWISIDGHVNGAVWAHLALPLFAEGDSMSVERILVLSEQLLSAE